MFRKCSVVLMVASTTLVLVAALTQAQEEKKAKKTDEEMKEETRQEHLKKLMRAYDLVVEGRKLNAPEYLITAAGMLRQLSDVSALQQMKKIDEKPEIT